LRYAQSSSARHVLRHDRRIAGHVLAHVARKCASVEIIAAAGAEADRQSDILAAIEVGDALGSGRFNEHSRRERAPAHQRHAGLPGHPDFLP
jgi:hypothetical protein